MSIIRKCSIAFSLLIISALSNAQENSRQCATLKSRMANKTTVADPAEENYDVKYVKLNIALDNSSNYISGDAITNARVVVSSMPAYVFELADPVVIDSVFIDGAPVTYTTSGVAHTVALATPLSMGTMFSAHVYYHGNPLTGSGPFAGTTGLNNMSSPSWGTNVTFSLSESYHANEWWPCKQSLHDKIDSSEVWVTIPDTLKAGSNGLLQHITPIDATHVRYEWKERHPIDHYLISVAVAPYVDYSYYMHFTGSSDSMLIQNYVYNNPATLPHFKPVIDSTGMMVDYLSSIYGRYPFWNEKYGHCMAPISGGMEHQTMTTLGYFEGTLVVHELGHQWFGDHVTCGTWADIMMNEGFAAYTENLYIDHFWNHAAAIADMADRETNVKSTADGTTYVDDTTSENRIFDSRLTYDKGACILHMLRFAINDDSAFFRNYRNWQQQMQDSSGTILEFANTTKGTVGTVVNGIDVDTFFNQWAFKEGYPIYDVKWNQVGTDVYVQLDQSTAVPASVPLFKTPINIQLHALTADTVIRVLNDAPSIVYHFTWTPTMQGTVLDPTHWLIMKVNSITHDLTLGIDKTTMPVANIAPNPTHDTWEVRNVPNNSTLTLTDVSGRTVWSQTASGQNISVPASMLTTGMYMLRITRADGISATYKLIKD